MLITIIIIIIIIIIINCILKFQISRYPNTAMGSCGVTNVIFDGFSDHVNDLLRNGVSRDTANDLREELMGINFYLQDLTEIGRALHENLPIYTSHISVKAHEEELSILRDQDQDRGQEIVYCFTLPGEETESFIDSNSGQVEPLLYPLLYPYGERGWGADLKTMDPKIDLMDYLKSKLLQPEPELLIYDIKRERKLNVNRYQAMSRLGQYWIIESLSRCLDQQIAFQRANQSYLSGGAVNDHQAGDGTAPSKLNDSIHGSPAHRKRKASEALEIVSQLGKSHLFTTMTVNPYCKKIQEQLLPGQTAFQRPDVVSRVFHAKKWL